jgi:hypothetical protein
MNTKLMLLLSVLLAMPLLLGACVGDAGLIIFSFGTPQSVEVEISPTATATLTPTSTPTPTATPTPVPTVCASPMEPGVWRGSALSNTVAGRSGFQVIDQDAVIDMALRISCDGSIIGNALRTGEANINVPLSVNGVCTDNADYEITGRVTGSPAQPTLDLTFKTRSGSLDCDVNSRLESVPSGEQSTDLTGQIIRVQVQAEAASNNHVEGSQWPDRLYQENMPQLDELIEEADLNVESASAWRFDRQEP